MLFAERVGTKEIDQRSREDSVDFGRSGRKHGASIETGDDRHDEAVAGQGGEVIKLSHHRDVGRIKEHLFVGLTKRRLHRRLALILSSARETHLTPVTAQVPRASGQQHFGTLVTFEQRYKNGRGAGTFKQSGRRLPVSAPLNAIE